MRFFITLYILLQSLAIVQSDDNTCDDQDGTCQNIPNEEECGLYLSPSTIPGAGLGIFVGREMFPGDAVGPGDIAIPVVDVSWHMATKKYFSHFSDYQWEGAVMGMAQDTDDSDIEAFCPGLDCAINCNLALINVGKSVPVWDDAGLHRYTSPGAGAITPYHNGTTLVQKYIPKGGELFKFYGDWWFESRPQTFGLIPLRHHHTEAETLCDKFASYNLAEPIAKDVWNIVASVPWESRYTNALPRTFEAAMQTADKGIRSLYQPSAQKPLEEIQAQGRCIDNIRHARSTLPHAGRGAFASRYILNGQVITGSPLLHIPDREFVSMYKIEPDPTNPGGRWKRNLEEKIGHQILLNYCWGHDETTILLCPYGVGVSYINHNKTKANVKIQWTKDGELSHNASFVDIDPLELMFDYKVHLAIDYVATRDIEEGEELFLDYGDAWEEAWNNHVASWEPSERSKHYAPAEVWNVQLANTPVRTEIEQELDPYPSHILVRAHPLLRKRSYRDDFALLDDNPWKITEKGFTCIVRTRRFDRNSMKFVYDVSVDAENEDGAFMNTMELKDVPRNALAFVDVPYSTDIHQRGVFRHELGIPEEMLSDAWKNR